MELSLKEEWQAVSLSSYPDAPASAAQPASGAYKKNGLRRRDGRVGDLDVCLVVPPVGYGPGLWSPPALVESWFLHLLSRQVTWLLHSLLLICKVGILAALTSAGGQLKVRGVYV